MINNINTDRARMRSLMWTAPLISWFTLFIFLVALLIAYVTNNETMLTAMLGVAAANATTVLNFWLGSSSSSHGKDAVIASQADQASQMADKAVATCSPLDKS